MASIAMNCSQGSVRKTNQDACCLMVAQSRFGEIVMVVVCDGKTPRNGFVCANGNEWILKKLKVRESNAIVYSIFNEKGSAK